MNNLKIAKAMLADVQHHLAAASRLRGLDSSEIFDEIKSSLLADFLENLEEVCTDAIAMQRCTKQ